MRTFTGPSLGDVLDVALLDRMIAEGFVKKAAHPNGELSVYNYTAAAQYNQVWNPVTRATRGLIVNADQVVVARPFEKFFNLSQHVAQELPSGPVHVTDKLDGSLGVLYPHGGSYGVATRGSFTSAQATHATAVWQSKYAGVSLPPEWTFLCEVIYPSNRVVVDYAGLDDLVFLGAIDTCTGRSVDFDTAASFWPGPVAARLPFSSLSQVLAAPDRPNVEGVVVHFVDSDLRVKVKQDEYVRLHRLVTGVSARRVWEALSSGVDVSGWLVDVPDEFYSFVSSTQTQLQCEFDAATRQVWEVFASLSARLGDAPRKVWAGEILALSSWPLHRALFAALDGKDFSHLVWNSVKPAEHVPMWNVSEDTS